MKLRDRMRYDSPVMAQLVERLEPLIDGQNLILGSALFGLLGDIATKYSAHRILTAGSVHGLADSTNVLLGTSDPTTKAGAITMVNDILAKFTAHIILTTGGVHGAADSVSTPAIRKLNPDADWNEIRDLANHLRSRYERHRVLTTGGVHGAADSTNAVADAVVTTEFIPSLDREV